MGVPSENHWVLGNLVWHRENTPGWPTMAERMGIAGRIKPRKRVDPEVAAEKVRRKQLQLQRKQRESKQGARAKRKEQKKSRKRNRKLR